MVNSLPVVSGKQVSHLSLNLLHVKGVQLEVMSFKESNFTVFRHVLISFRNAKKVTLECYLLVNNRNKYDIDSSFYVFWEGGWQYVEGYWR